MRYIPPCGELDSASEDENRLTVEDLDRIDAEFDEGALTRKVYSISSETLFASVDKAWKDYCAYRKRDPYTALEAVSVKVLYGFFYWMLHERKKTLRSMSTLETYWKVFCLVRERHVGSKLDRLLVVQMKDVLKALAKEFNLESDKREKTAMYAEDLFEVLKTQWTSPEMTFDHERHRVELCLFMLLAGTTGNRPAALLALRYRDVEASLIRDPAGGSEPYILLEFKYTQTKGYLGQKDSNTFAIPQIRHDPCLVLSPHTYFLALAFSDQAFAAQGLTNPAGLFKLNVVDGLYQAHLPWKEEVLDLPIFRRSCRTVQGVGISQNQLRDSTIRPWLRKLGEITGMEKICHPYVLRYAAGKAFDSCEGISDSLRNLIMQHSKSEVFQQHYLPRQISADTQAAYRGMPAQSAVMRAATSMRRGIDPRRPRRLSPEQLSRVERHPKVVRARKLKDALTFELKQAKKEVGSETHVSAIQTAKDQAQQAFQREKRRQKDALLKSMRRSFKREQAIADIQNQLEDLPVEETKQAKCVRMLPERARVYEALFTLPKSTLREERSREARAIAALVTLCAKKEDRRHAQICSQAPASDSDEHKLEILPDSDVAVFDDSSKSCSRVCKPTQCFLCLGDEELPSEKRTKEFCRREVLKKHMFRYHLRHHAEDGTIVCPLDGESLHGHSHVLRHGHSVHGTPFQIR